MPYKALEATPVTFAPYSHRGVARFSFLLRLTQGGIS